MKLKWFGLIALAAVFLVQPWPAQCENCKDIGCQRYMGYVPIMLPQMLGADEMMTVAMAGATSPATAQTCLYSNKNRAFEQESLPSVGGSAKVAIDNLPILSASDSKKFADAFPKTPEAADTGGQCVDKYALEPPLGNVLVKGTTLQILGYDLSGDGKGQLFALVRVTDQPKASP
ncbi:MAG: hypothetical protein AB7H77_08255 [Bdellovibrionales bacterium]